MNDIKLTEPFTARWVECYDKDGDRIYDTEWIVAHGDDIEVDSWEDLARIVEDTDRDNIVARLEFQTYDVDENGECIDSTIMDYCIDWVEGICRLFKLVASKDWWVGE